jgi:CDP-diacylglycerol--glycerol-3-phosphate 3-phosphatidyltransferase
MKKTEVAFFNIANIITFFRVILIPLFLVFLFKQSFPSLLTALIFFSTASLSDFFDGFLARRLELHTRFGVFADPLADKLLVGSAFIAFLLLPSIVIPVWLVAIILVREVFVTVMRIAAIRRDLEMKTEYSGKIKTFFQMIAILSILILLLLGQRIFDRGLSEAAIYSAAFWEPFVGARGALLLHHLPAILVGITALLAVVSMVHYLVKNWRILTLRDATGKVK